MDAMRNYTRVLSELFDGVARCNALDAPSPIWAAMKRLHAQGWKSPIPFPLRRDKYRVVHPSGFAVRDTYQLLPPHGAERKLVHSESAREKWYQIRHELRHDAWEMETWIETGEWP